MPKLVLVPGKSHIRVRTFAEGVLARLAHDLELTCREPTGTAERTSADAGTAVLAIPIASIEVAGTLRGDRIDPGGLSSSERQDCLRKMCKDVFHTRPEANAVLRIDASLEGSTRARLRLTVPSGRTVERGVDVRLDSDGSNTRVSGHLDLSLDAIGSRPVKGPMNAFRVKDAVTVHFDVLFVETTT